MNLKKIVLLGFGWLSLLVAGVGIVFPFLPITMPFLLVAAWAFGHASPAMREKIRNNQPFGPYVRGWQDHKLVPTNAKIAATFVITAAAFYMWFLSPLPKLIAGAFIIMMVAAEIYLLSRPEKKL